MNTNEIFNQMLSSYDITTELQKRNAIFEVNQQIILSGLYNGGFFNEAAFYGGTCLRIFHGLHRFSEDMDFSLLAPNKTLILHIIFSPSLTNSLWWVERLKSERRTKRTLAKWSLPF